jgi:glycosidase
MVIMAMTLPIWAVSSPAATPAPSVAADQPQNDGYWLHRFEYRPDHAAQSVHVAGDFNNWSTTANPLQRGEDGLWRASVRLDEGVHHYKFVVDGKQWVTDPDADKSLNEGDNYGGVNSGVFVGLDGRKLQLPRPDAINDEAVSHRPDDWHDFNVVAPHLLKLSIRVQANDLQSAVVWMQEKPQGQWRQTSLARISSQWGFDYYGAVLPIDSTKVQYIFQLTDGKRTQYDAADALYDSREEAEAAAYTRPVKTWFITPQWAQHAVWYQIFPERFRNGDTANDPPNTVRWQSKWFSKLPGETGKFYNDVWNRRYGGDFQGIIWALPYLRELGINAIYLNPIFKAKDLHKYDTADYRHVDDHFGFKGDISELRDETDDPKTWQWTKTDKLFLRFLADAHKQGFKVIIDGVFNHVGKDNYMFQDVLKNGRKSKYASWFEIKSWGPPIHYEAWDGPDGALPVFKKDPKLGLVHGPREYIMAITRRWLAPDGDSSKGVDGFRLDVPNDIPHPFWVEWRKLVKHTKPDAFICGEIWSMAQPWLRGDEFDGVMNYQFAMASQDFFVNDRLATTPAQLTQRLGRLLRAYPFQADLVNQNLLDSHDTDRAASMFVNPDRAFDQHNRIQDNGKDYSPAKPSPLLYRRMRQEVAFQMTFVGAPMIYYGDENGMWGPDDPSNRQPMVWRDLQPFDDPQVQFDSTQFTFYQRAIAVHRRLAALQLGTFAPLLADNSRGVLAFMRQLGNQRAYVILNRSDRAQEVTLPVGDSGPLYDWMDEKQVRLETESVDRPELKVRADAIAKTPSKGVVRIELAPYSTAVLSGK